MYLPAHFKEDRPEVLHALMRAHPLAALVTHGPSGMEANHIPMLLDAGAGVLRGHVSRANLQSEASGEALAIFQGPQAYISPNWYPTKAEHGRVVPTWNYAVVHVWGEISIDSEPEKLMRLLEQLTAEHESAQPRPWRPSDAPEAYIQGQLRAIVGVELRITRIEGKWKMSQNQPVANREGAAAALELGGRADVARRMR